MKVHTVMKYHVGVPMVVQLTSAAKNDHYLLKEVHLPKDATLTMDSKEMFGTLKKIWLWLYWAQLLYLSYICSIIIERTKPIKFLLKV